MSQIPTSTGIGAPGSGAAPASLARSPMASQPAPAASTAVPFVRGSSLATMQDSSGTWTAGTTGSTNQVQLQTNAFLAYLVLEIVLTTSGNSAAVVFAPDGPWNIINQITLNDPANQAIIAPLSGYGAYLMSKYLTDTGCFFDPKQDPFYSATAGTPATGGSFSFRLVIPVEHRARDALGAVNNSAANQRYLLGVNIVAPSTSNVYNTAPTTAAATVSYAITQLYWTSPPASITTSGGSTSVQQTPTGLGTVGFIRYETHTEVSGGGTPQIQLNNVGDYLSAIVFVLRDTSSTGPRDINSLTQSSTAGNWPNPFTWWVNDFQVHSVPFTYYQNRLARFYRYPNGVETAGGLDNGVFPLFWLSILLDRVENFTPASQYLPTDATTKLQIRGATFGSGAAVLQVFTRAIRPVSGAALFA